MKWRIIAKKIVQLDKIMGKDAKEPSEMGPYKNKGLYSDCKDTLGVPGVTKGNIDQKKRDKRGSNPSQLTRDFK